MKNISIQIQTVLYHNEIRDLKRAVEYMANALEVCRNIDDCLIDAVLCWGDASKNPLFQTEEIEGLNRKYEDIVKIKYDVFGFNSGTSKGHNRLAKGCQADYMLIMNPDVLLCPDFFVEVMKPFSDEKVGMVEGRQTPIEHHKEYDIETGETGWATLACAVLRRKLYDELNGLDEDSFFMYCDDLDFSWRVRMLGYKIIYKPSAMVYHSKKLSVSGAWLPTPAEIYYSAEAALLVAHKWSNPKRVKKLLQLYSAQEGPEKKAADEYLRRKAEGKLPNPIDPEHKVATFIGDYYSENRFVF